MAALFGPGGEGSYLSHSLLPTIFNLIWACSRAYMATRNLSSLPYPFVTKAIRKCQSYLIVFNLISLQIPGSNPRESRLPRFAALAHHTTRESRACKMQHLGVDPSVNHGMQHLTPANRGTRDSRGSG